jgi:hypothetical protein
MPHYFALLSVVYMTSFVWLFDKLRFDRCQARFTKEQLMTGLDIEKLRRIFLACDEG